MKDSKNLVIGMLCAVICIMAVAYAAFSTTLNINGTATIASSWCVRIQDNPTCTATPVTGGAAGSATASVTKDSVTQATISMSFTQPGDSATCTVVFENCGTLDAKLNKLTVTGNDATGPILFTVSGITEGSVLTNTTGKHTVTITGTYDSNVEDQPSTTEKTLTVSAEYVQNL